MEDYSFSTILYVDNESLFDKAVSNLKENGMIEENVQLIVVDPFVSNSVSKSCAEIKDASYLSLEDIDMPSAYQQGLSCAKGDFVNFTLASSSYTNHVYKNVKKVLSQYKTDLVALCAFFINEKGEKTPYGGSCKPNKKMEQINLEEHPHQFQLLLQSYFFRRERLEGHAFQPKLHGDALYQFLLKVLADCPIYVYLSNSEYHFTMALEDNTSVNPLQYCNWWYHQSVTEFMTSLLAQVKTERNNIPEFMQVACYYLIYSKFDCNYNNINKGVLKTKDEVNCFLHVVYQLLIFIDNSVIMNKNITSYTKARRSIRMLLLRGKADALNKELKVVDIEHNFVALMESKYDEQESFDENHETILARTNQELLHIQVMNYEDGMLHIDANVGLADFLRVDEYETYAICTLSNGEEVTCQAQRTEVYPLVKCFGVTFQRNHPIQFYIPVSNDPMQKINFYYRFNGQSYQFKIQFDTYNSRIGSRYDYWIFKKGWMATWSKKETLVIRKCGMMTHLKQEFLLALVLLHKRKGNISVAFRGLLLRLIYWITLSHYSKKHIWVTFDKQYKAGDNGEYMYHYIRENHSDDVEIYYIIRKEAPEYSRLVREDKKHILVYGTLRCQLISLMAEALLSTHVNNAAQYNPSRDYNIFTKDLQRGELVCIQHGLTVQKIAQFQNRVYDNTKFYCCASSYEISNLSKPIYGYAPEQLRLVGLARYDGLKNRDQKIILITPSWRRNIVNTSVANTRKTHNDNFKGSDYFRIYNALINDQRLIDCARQYGYRIVYLLHPSMSAQINDFDRNEYVELVPATGDVSYEKILCESSLMVTDYSGVQFDFAYMRKPIVYYHPEVLPPQYEEGGFIYSTMSFGPICTNHQEVVEALCGAMKNSCQMEAEYVRRADDFFAYDDHNNCQRIYDEIKSWMDQ